jgi:hypothetical protein
MRPLPMQRSKSVADLDAAPRPGSPFDFGRLIAEETQKWAKVIRAAGIKAQ